MDLFLTYTPLHLLLTLALLKNETSPALILVGEHFELGAAGSRHAPYDYRP